VEIVSTVVCSAGSAVEIDGVSDAEVGVDTVLDSGAIGRDGSTVSTMSSWWLGDDDADTTLVDSA
jgi:hypothetical protein